ncbi:MAG: MmcQ/YjbR family DNA-binding protein [Clostridiales bacterium]|nr:MmcQ/YjbR family DNA-binding protein [Clostridiales bacterium]MCD7827229.1 MmcQ/YjbR family DNA-binding protein [Clostridiales bacterium]
MKGGDFTDRQGLFDYVMKEYGDEPEYPWAKDFTSAVLRHETNKKWYGLVMNIPKSRLGLPSEEAADILNVKCDPLLIDILKQSDGFFPAYHMNKTHWLTVLLDGTVPDEQVCGLLDDSFKMTL